MKKTISIIAVILLLTVFYSYAANKDKGIGPIKILKLDPINQNLANKGKAIFDAKCFTCHTLDQKKIGPPLRNVTKLETPEFIMNLLLNTVEMQQKNEHIKQLIAQYNKVLMIDYKLPQNDARAVLEYLRSAAEGK